jgi:hypothetical protein
VIIVYSIWINEDSQENCAVNELCYDPDDGFSVACENNMGYQE